MKEYPWLYRIGSVCVIIGTAFAIKDWSWTPWVYLFGAILYTLYFLLMPHKQMTLRYRRLVRMAFFSGILLIISSSFMLRHNNLWILLFALAMVFAIYSTVLLALNKDKDGEDKNEGKKKNK
ncbi:hypothetical protein [Falsiporphyromonas endometrii]|uniref:Uncharacterized protein n=1 Tax=Falsiporphyromonas endometrii TaxID=1387297 RepID=A0ABV9K6M0_9PORP